MDIRHSSLSLFTTLRDFDSHLYEMPSPAPDSNLARCISCPNTANPVFSGELVEPMVEGGSAVV